MRILSQRDAFAWYIYAAMSDEEYARHAADVDDFLSNENNFTPEGVHKHDSRQLHSRGGHWTRERRGQQKQMLHDLYKQWSAGIPQEGLGMIMGGMGGSGKGTIQDLDEARLDAGRYMKLDPDEIKKEMARRNMIPQVPGLSPMEASGLVHEEASDLAKELSRRAIKDRRNLLWDITMSSPKSVSDRIRAMREGGYGQVDGAFVDVDPRMARQRVEDRHRRGEEAYREQPPGPDNLGGRWIPKSVSARSLPKDPASGEISSNGESFGQVNPEFDNAVKFDFGGPSGALPQVTGTRGRRWHNHPLSTGGTTMQPNMMESRRRMAADEATQFSAQPTVKELIDQYGQGQVDFDALLAGVAQVGHFAAEGGDLADRWNQAEELPDDNSFFWVYGAEFDDVLTPDEVDAIADAVQQP